MDFTRLFLSSGNRFYLVFRSTGDTDCLAWRRPAEGKKWKKKKEKTAGISDEESWLADTPWGLLNAGAWGALAHTVNPAGEHSEGLHAACMLNMVGNTTCLWLRTAHSKLQGSTHTRTHTHYMEFYTKGIRETHKKSSSHTLQPLRNTPRLLTAPWPDHQTTLGKIKAHTARLCRTAWAPHTSKTDTHTTTHKQPHTTSLCRRELASPELLPYFFSFKHTICVLFAFFFPRFFFFFFFEAFNDSVRAVKSHFETNHADTHTLSHTHTHTFKADVCNEISDDKTICQRCQNQWPLKIHHNMTQNCFRVKMDFRREHTHTHTHTRTHTHVHTHSSKGIWIPNLVTFYSFMSVIAVIYVSHHQKEPTTKYTTR